MFHSLYNWIWTNTVNWLTEERSPVRNVLWDFERLSYELRPCDIILVEGRSRVSEVIKMSTQSNWTHAAMYIGRLHDIDSPALREKIGKFYAGDPTAQLLVESVLGKGTIITSLSHYQTDHLRICRPQGVTRQDAQQITGYAINALGTEYDVRQILDLMRFMFPYGIAPRRWRSTLFRHNAGGPTKTVCSTMLADAFASVRFPILPIVKFDKDGNHTLYRRNPKLYTPSDFDYSPYFDIIKYPVFGIEGPAVYRQLPWNEEGMFCNDDGECYIPIKQAPPADDTD